MVDKSQSALQSSRDSADTVERNSGTGVAGRVSGPGTLFGVPLGDLGWFTSLLMGTATGFAAFFAATFIGIVSILIHNSRSTPQQAIDFTYSYTRVGLPFGVLALIVALTYLGTLWVRRITRRS